MMRSMLCLLQGRRGRRIRSYLLYAAQFRSLTLDLGYFLRWGRLGDISAESRADSERPVAYEAYEAVHRRSEKIRTDSQGLRSQNTVQYFVLYDPVVGYHVS